MGGRDGWRRAAVVIVVAAAAVTGVAVVRRDLPRPDPPPVPAPTRAPERTLEATEPGDRAPTPPAALPEGPWPERSPRWTARDAADRWRDLPAVHGPVAVGGLVLAVGGHPGADRVAAYDARTGRPRWRHRPIDVASLWAASRRAVVVGSDRGELEALAPETGRRRWRVRLAPGQGPDAATLSGDRLYVATSFTGEGDLRPPVVYALDARTGRRRWRAALGRGTDLQWGAPVLAEELVVVASTPSDPGSAAGHALHALDAATGRARWELALPASQPGYHTERPLLHRGLLIVPASGSLLAVDPSSGRVVWRRPGTGLPTILGPAGRLVLAAFQDDLVALAARDGQERWRLPVSGGDHRWVDMADGRVDVLTAGLALVLDPATAGLVALAAGSGQVAWVGDLRRLTGRPVVAGGRVLVTTGSGDLLAYAP